nr:hypothetical protein [uncultured Noviherbaspirillum sp.]
MKCARQPLNRARRPGCCRGQALTEFLIVSLVLIPLFLLIPLIGKYQDISHATQMASRYAAFDAVLRNDSHNSWKPPRQLEAELRQRIFGPAGAGIVTTPENGPVSRDNWRDPYGNALVRAPDDVTLTFGVEHGATHEEAYAGADDTAVFPLAAAAGLGSRGLYRANVAVALANLPAGLKSVEPFDRLNLRIERHASVLPDPWTANSPAQTERRAGALAPINEVMPEALIAAAVAAIDMKAVAPPVFGDLQRWRDLVPLDRLRAAEPP